MAKNYTSAQEERMKKYNYLCANVCKGNKVIAKYFYQMPYTDDQPLSDKIKYAKDFAKELDSMLANNKSSTYTTYQIAALELSKKRGEYKYIYPEDMRNLVTRMKERRERIKAEFY